MAKSISKSNIFHILEDKYFKGRRTSFFQPHKCWILFIFMKEGDCEKDKYISLSVSHTLKTHYIIL